MGRKRQSVINPKASGNKNRKHHEKDKKNEKQNVQKIFLSPIFQTNKSKKKLGIIKFNNLSKYTNIPLVALGGIKPNNIKQLNLINIDGFAGISYFN